MTLAAAVLAGALLRLAMLASGKSLWGDEWFTIDLISKPLPEVIRGAVADVHPPLYFVLARGFVAVLGPHEWVFRLPSLLAGTGVIVFIFLLAERAAGKRAAAAAALWAAVSPYFLQSSNEIRGYALFGFLSAGAFYFTLRVLEDAPRRAPLALQALFLSLVVWSEHYGWFVWSAAAAAAAFEARRSRAPLIAPMAALALGFPSLLVALRQALYSEHVFDASRMGEYLSFGILAKKAAGIFWHWTCGYRFSMLTVEGLADLAKSSPLFWASFAATLAAAGLFAGQALRGPGAVRWRRLLLFGAWLPAAFLAAAYPIRLDARYLAFAAPLFFAAVSAGLGRLSGPLRTACLAGLAGVSLSGAAHAILLPTDAVHREDYRALARDVFGGARAGDAVAGLAPQVRYYSRELAVPAAGERFDGLREFLASDPGRFRRLWLLGVTNMHPEVARRIREDNDRLLKAAGFRRSGPTKRYGGTDGLATFDIYEQSA